MIFGIAVGIFSALLQASSYVFSTLFLKRHHSSTLLLTYSQVILGVVSFPFLLITFPKVPHELWPTISKILVFWVIAFLVAQFAFFRAQTTIEPSRISSLLGLKIPLLAFFSFCTGDWLAPGQWIAVGLVTAAAFCLNWSGGCLSVKGLLWLSITLIGYAYCDITETQAILVVADSGQSLFFAAATIIFLFYTVLGLAAFPLLFRQRFSREVAKDALPYAGAWYISQIALFYCYGVLGPVFGNVIQASRGIFSILLGLIIIHLGFNYPEPSIGKKAWLRRLAAALLMTAGISLYAISK